MVRDNGFWKKITQIHFIYYVLAFYRHRQEVVKPIIIKLYFKIENGKLAPVNIGKSKMYKIGI